MTLHFRHPVTRKLHENRNYGERLADHVVGAMGSWKFIIVQTVIVTAWIMLNVVAFSYKWDPYPFILLNLAFSTQAAYAAPLILLSGNRSADRDRHMAEHDLAINEKAEEEIRKVLDELVHNTELTLQIVSHLKVK